MLVTQEYMFDLGGFECGSQTRWMCMTNKR